uniref:Uncharacterized protein n=1 Tax=viral metagenome TaxID=1070528 RepID=A0A6M3JZ63_9ZZZZ
MLADNTNLFRLIERVAVWLFVLILSILGFMLRSALSDLDTATDRIVNIEKSMAVVQGNRFTATDGLELQRQLSILATRMPSEFPPKTWLDTVYSRDQNSIEKMLTVTSSNQQVMQDNQQKFQLLLEKIGTNQAMILERLGKIETKISD